MLYVWYIKYVQDKKMNKVTYPIGGAFLLLLIGLVDTEEQFSISNNQKQ